MDTLGNYSSKASYNLIQRHDPLVKSSSSNNLALCLVHNYRYNNIPSK